MFFPLRLRVVTQALLLAGLFIYVWSAPTVRAQDQDATALEARYRTCAKHSIPADKCTPEIFQQLQEKDNAPLEPKAAAALKAAKEYQARLKNPDSMQVRTAYVLDGHCRKCGADDYLVCLEVGGQNGAGGMTVSRVAVQLFQGKEHWFDDTGVLGALGGDNADRWNGTCTNPKTPFHPNPQLKPGGMDVTEKVNQALKRDK
jgi:hypothetical protein